MVLLKVLLIILFVKPLLRLRMLSIRILLLFVLLMRVIKLVVLFRKLVLVSVVLLMPLSLVFLLILIMVMFLLLLVVILMNSSLSWFYSLPYENRLIMLHQFIRWITVENMRQNIDSPLHRLWQLSRC